MLSQGGFDVTSDVTNAEGREGEWGGGGEVESMFFFWVGARLGLGVLCFVLLYCVRVLSCRCF